MVAGFQRWCTAAHSSIVIVFVSKVSGGAVADVVVIVVVVPEAVLFAAGGGFFTVAVVPAVEVQGGECVVAGALSRLPSHLVVRFHSR